MELIQQLPLSEREKKKMPFLQKLPKKDERGGWEGRKYLKTVPKRKKYKGGEMGKFEGRNLQSEITHYIAPKPNH